MIAMSQCEDSLTNKTSWGWNELNGERWKEDDSETDKWMVAMPENKIVKTEVMEDELTIFWQTLQRPISLMECSEALLAVHNWIQSNWQCSL